MQTSQYGFCALACMVGLFSEQAVLKLKQMSEHCLHDNGTRQRFKSAPVESKPQDEMTNVRLCSSPPMGTTEKSPSAKRHQTCHRRMA